MRSKVLIILVARQTAVVLAPAKQDQAAAAIFGSRRRKE